LISDAIARIDDRIGAVTTCGKIVRISFGPTGQEVIAGSAIERIRATLAKQGIVAAEAKEGVVPARGVEHVVSTAASSDGVHVVVFTITDQSIVHAVATGYDVERRINTGNLIEGEKSQGIGRV